MPKLLLSVLFVALCWSSLTCGCSSVSQCATEEKRVSLGHGDCLEVLFRNVHTLEVHRLIDLEGNISLPFVEKLHVAGLTLEDAQALIHMKYHQFESYAHFDVIVSKCR
jgi:protein involved in polysaccharide export with SLBB domain